MAKLRAPDGREYVTDDEAKIKSLRLGQGYTVLDNDEPPQSSEPPPAPGPQLEQPASAPGETPTE